MADRRFEKIPQTHPRLLGDAGYLKDLAERRPEAFRRTVQIALEREGDEHQVVMSSALVYAITGDEGIGRYAVEIAMRTVNRGIRTGHEPFGCDLAVGAVAYDLCHSLWDDAERLAYFDHVNRTVDANHNAERSPFHNAFFSYKYWGYGLAALATFGENPQAEEILALTDHDIRTYADPALRLAGDGGGWAEGYYVHYWIYRWLFFCEAARRCAGIDYYALTPEFFSHRAVADMFECLPASEERGLPAQVQMGDGGGGIYTWDRDDALAARRILASYYRDDPAHRAVHAFNARIPYSGYPTNAYRDFLWDDDTLPSEHEGLEGFKLSHMSPGPGYVYARSSWDDDATYLFFSCGPRFTAHQHLDAGHFTIYRRGELAGDGGHYYAFARPHEVGYGLRSIAHSTILVHDPDEVWPDIRLGGVQANDGGQHHAWPHHNGAVTTPQEWEANRELFDIAQLTAYADDGTVVYTAGDASRAYSPKKVETFTRQVVFIRPSTIVIFDRVKAVAPSFGKTWLLQAKKRPTVQEPFLVVDNGASRLFVQTLLPEACDVRLCDGDALYTVDGQHFPPDLEVRPAPECRVEVRPREPAAFDTFLTVLTTAGLDDPAPPPAAVVVEGDAARVTISPVAGESVTMGFALSSVAGWYRVGDRPEISFVDSVERR